MAIEITEKMTVRSSIEDTWRFIVDPERVVTCMPGAALVEQLDAQTYVGRVKVKLGAITTDYKGEVVFAARDETARTLRLTGEGRETGGGTAKGTLDVRLSEVDDGTELVFDIRVDLTGRVMQVGRGMIKGVSAQIFKQFAAAASRQIEASTGGAGAGGATAMRSAAETASGAATAGAADRSAVVAARDDAAAPESLSIVPLLARTIASAIADFFRRLLGRSAPRDR